MSIEIVSSPSGNEQKRSKYRILGLVGQGQFGRVYCAVHRQTGRLVALKDLDRQRFSTHKFLRELRFLLSLRHPNIVACHALEHTHGGRYLVMDYCEGGTLRYLLESEGRLHLSQSIKLITDILAGLDHAHSKGIVHCDIKPENILLTNQPHGWSARISDFGIARLSQDIEEDARSDDSQGNTGSPAYMAPERFYGQHSRSSDLYSVGILLYELLVGDRPFSGTPAELMSAHLNQPLKVPDSVPEAWRPVLITSLQKLAGRRFHSAEEMLATVRSASLSEGVELQGCANPVQLPLLQVEPSIDISALKAKRVEPLEMPITALAIATHTSNAVPRAHPGNDVYVASGVRLSVRNHLAATWAKAEEDPSQIRQSLKLSGPIQDLMLRPQGCFVMTERAVYLLPSDGELGHTTPHLMSELTQPYRGHIEAKGRWLATVTPSNSVPELLRFVDLESIYAPVSLAPEPIQLTGLHASTQLIGVFALDSRHVAIAYRFNKNCANAKTTFDLYTRRGKRFGSITVPLNLANIRCTPTPYRLIAIDTCDPNSILLIDLKPFRVMRYGVEITPRFIEPTPWGFILMDTEGRMLLLDEYGQKAGRLNGPTHVTAIASYNYHELLIASWRQEHGNLFTVDLKEADVDILF